jgi:hypothetical protein
MIQATFFLIGKFKCHFISLCLLIFCSTFLLNQARAQSRISGKIVDSTGRPIANANVLLLNSKDSVLVKGMLTTESGLYNFENINTGSYLISATHTGTSPVYTQLFQISEKLDRIDMGTIRLNETSVTLADVAVSAKNRCMNKK